jgi:hypothetical protein
LCQCGWLRELYSFIGAIGKLLSESLKERTFRVRPLEAFSSLHIGLSSGFSGPVGLGKFGVLFADVRCEVLKIVGFAVKIAVSLVGA